MFGNTRIENVIHSNNFIRKMTLRNPDLCLDHGDFLFDE